jgi:NAD(P)H-flavin reductase/nitrite reductase/ring-hydroxylating ferredoxin subunit
MSTTLPPPADAPVVAGFTCVGRLSDVLPARGLAKAVVGPTATPVVLVNDGAGQLHALFGMCPHKYAEMQLGDIEEAAGPDGGAGGIAVKCPRHRKKFNGGLNFRVADGSSWVNQPCVGKYEPAWCLPVFAVRLEPAHAPAGAAGGEVLVYVSDVPIRGTVPPPPPPDSEGEGGEGKGKGKGKGEGKGKDGATVEGGAGAAGTAAVAHRHTDAGEPGVAWLPATVAGIEPVSADSSVYSLRCPFPAAAPSADPWSWHVSLRFPGDAFLSREYTPLSTVDEWRRDSLLRLLIKHYAVGKLTSRLRALDAGAALEVTPPETTLATPALLPPSELTAAGGHPFPAGAPVLLIAGGTGVTPILQLARWAVASHAGAAAGAGSTPRVAIAVSQHTPLDQLAAGELLALAREHPHSVRLLRLFTRVGGVGVGMDGVCQLASGAGETGWVAHQRLTAPVLTAWHAAMEWPSPGYARVVVSGPRGMFRDVAAAVGASLGVPAAALVELEA